MPSVHQTFESRADLVAIDVDIRRANPAAADRVLDAITTTLQLLAELPMIGRSREELAPGLRSLPVKRYGMYLIFYRPSPDGIQVIRVTHGARDLPRELRGR